MLDAHLPLPNLCWDPADPAAGPPDRTGPDTAARLTGRFATALRERDTVVLARDRLGLNKLFAAYHRGRLAVANNLADLTAQGIAFRDICAVPAGTVVTVDVPRRTAATHRYYTLPATSGSHRAPAQSLTDAATALDRGMAQLAAARPNTPAAICLSGGADSSLIALYAKRHFPDLTAYTYAYTGPGAAPSPDAEAAERVAQHLGIELRAVPADAQAVLQALPRAITYGQDWRDFNVHAAIVNDLLATAIAADHPPHPTGRPLVLTGDLMNEFLGDYSPLRYAGTTYYPLPQVSAGRLRTALTRGIQAGDREVGVFHAHGLDVVQPYSWALQPLLDLPDPLVKPDVMRALAHGGLPESVLARPKARAQIGAADIEQGILPVLIGHGHDSHWLRHAFCHAFDITDAAELDRFLRSGVYRPLPRAAR